MILLSVTSRSTSSSLPVLNWLKPSEYDFDMRDRGKQDAEQFIWDLAACESGGEV